MVELLTSVLRFAGYQVRIASSGANARTATEEWAPALMVQDGFTVARYLHGRRCTVPAIFLTPGDQLHGKLPGLTVGGGSYIAKPFSPDELVAGVRAVLRRSGADTAGPDSDGVLRFADLELREDTYEVSRAGEAIQLTLTEFRLLRYLMNNTERVLTRAQILDHVWPYDHTGDERIVASYVFRLRQKVDRVGLPLIHTLRRVGYILRLPRE
ncbi:two-component system OmpR family response regulator [Pseudonocardia eucalypti]|nr:two-component system OmpR family response regulator [Pseudonocardia eucalypti]